MQRLWNPLFRNIGNPNGASQVAHKQSRQVIRVRSEGLGLRTTARCFDIHKNTVTEWENKFAEQKAPLMLYTICHHFIKLTFEGDELYTVVGRRVAPSDSQG